MLVHSVPCRLLSWRHYLLSLCWAGSCSQFPASHLPMVAHKLAGCFQRLARERLSSMNIEPWSMDILSFQLYLLETSHRSTSTTWEWEHVRHEQQQHRPLRGIGELLKRDIFTKGQRELLGWWINYFFVIVSWVNRGL